MVTTVFSTSAEPSPLNVAGRCADSAAANTRPAQLDALE